MDSTLKTTAEPSDAQVDPERRSIGKYHPYPALSADLVSPSAEAGKMLSLGGRIALARRRKGWTQQELSPRVGKSRATVIQYEQGRLQPPVQQIEVLAKVLDVSPEWIAFGRQGINGLEGATAEVTAVPEIELVDGQEMVRGGYGLPDTIVDHLGIEPGKSRILALGQAAPAFGLAAGDRIIVNPEGTLSQEHRLYALKTKRGIEVVRLAPRLSQRTNAVKLNDGNGESHSYEQNELEVLGLIVGSIHAC
jgi:transcriptional regulator with XRE-family HTH domain